MVHGQDMGEYEASDEATAALNRQLYELGQEGKRHPERRRQLANQMFRLIQNSGRLGRFGAEAQDYADARSRCHHHRPNAN